MRALVLGGGGLTGIGWMWGIIAGLAASGVDLGAADLVIGTSAGSVVGAVLTAGGDTEAHYARQLAAPGAEIPVRVGLGLMARWGWAAVRSRDPDQLGRRVGRVALAAETVPASARREVIASRLPVHSWPERRLQLAAVDADSGERVVLDRDAGVDLVDAVAASCAVPGVWPAVPAGGRRLIDGGVRSPANADLAAGADRVVILAPVTRGLGAMTAVAAQAAELRRHARVAVVQPDRDARRAIGRNALDPARRAPAARAGRVQAPSAVAEVRGVWQP
jgi:NTE family protein